MYIFSLIFAFPSQSVGISRLIPKYYVIITRKREGAVINCFSIDGLLANFLYLFLKINYVQSFPEPLDAKTEKKYFDEMKKGSMKAREKLIEHNLRLVAHIVKKYYGAARSQEDLISIGNIGLIKAIDSYDPDNGTRFATYASKCLQNEILMYFRSQKKSTCEVSINETIDTDKDGNPLTYIDVLCCDDTIAEDIDLKIKNEIMIDSINRLLDRREKEIIVLRYGLNNKKPLTQREVAARLGISRSYVSRIEKSIIEKLRAAF